MIKGYKKFIVGAVVAVSALNMTAFGAEWYDDAVKHGKEREIISADYNINGMLTRGEMAEMLSAAADLKAYYIDNPFSDIEIKDSYTDDIIRLYNADIYKGREDNGKLYADADEVLTREQAAAFIVRTYGFSTAKNSELKFTDSDDISDYSKKDICILTEMGIVSGYDDGTFKPQNNVSKTEFLAMLYKADEALDGKIPNVNEKSVITDDRLSKNISIVVLNSEPINADSEIKLRFTRLGEEPEAIYAYNPQIFQLEKKINGQWIEISRDNENINDINYQIKADNSSDRTIKLSDFYNDLESGEYRLVYGFRVNGIGIEKGIKYGVVNFNLEKTEFAEEK